MGTCIVKGCDNPATGLQCGRDDCARNGGAARPAVRRPDDGDVHRALHLFRSLCPGSDSMQMLVIEGNPSSKARPRFGRSGQVYTPKATKDDEMYLALKFKEAFRRPMRKNVAVGCVFYRENRQRIDVDNMLKQVMDAATGVVWHDDSQVTAQMGVVELDPDNPRTVVVIGEHDSTMKRAYQQVRSCKHCGEDFQPANYATKYCSRKCAARDTASRRLSDATCPTCRETFRRKKAAQKYCSRSCAGKARKGAGPKNSPPTCKHCGKRVSRREYQRCRECFRAGKGA